MITAIPLAEIYLSKMLSIKIPVELFTDSKSIFATITKLTSIKEKRLLIDLTKLRHAYTSGRIRNLGHIQTEFNIADPLTKKMNSAFLSTLPDTGKLERPVNHWILHPTEALPEVYTLAKLSNIHPNLTIPICR